MRGPGFVFIMNATPINDGFRRTGQLLDEPRDDILFGHF
jgi:hypothetical protein